MSGAPPPPFQAQIPMQFDPNLVGSVFNVYAKSNPLKLPEESKGSYWVQVFKFLNYIHEVLCHPNHEMNLRNIKSDNYYFLVKMCVDYSFTVPEIITIRNDKESKVCKVIANDLLKTGPFGPIIPTYITYLGGTQFPLNPPNPLANGMNFPRMPPIPPNTSPN
jgi:hypothetical protein